MRITHLPTGVVVSQQDEKSQHKNRARAMRIMRARLFERARAEREAERAADRRAQIGGGRVGIYAESPDVIGCFVLVPKT